MAGYGRVHRREAVTPHQRLIQAAGGPRQIARLTGFPEQTVISWNNRGRISAKAVGRVLAVLRQEGLDPGDMMSEDRAGTASPSTGTGD